MTDLEIRHGRIIDPGNGIDRTGTIYIHAGKILSVDNRPAGFQAGQIIDADEQIICPGFIDLSTRLREPGQTSKATVASETQAAAKGGFTTLCVPPDTRPVTDTPAVVELIKETAEQAGFQQVYPTGAFTRGLQGQELSSMYALKQAGCIAVSNAQQPLENLLILRRAMEYAASHDLLLLYQANDYWLSNQGCAHEGAFATRYGLPGIPEVAETIALAQCLELVKLTGCRVHFSQISCARSVEMLRQAKDLHLPVSADTAIHQLHLTEDDIEPFNSAYHVIPPLRSQADRQALREGVASGVIDAICTDHQPHDFDAKLGAFPETEPGMSTLETLLPLMLQLVTDGIFSLQQGIAALTSQPAAILGLHSGNLSTETAADICLFNPERKWTVDAEHWRSRGKNTPFWGDAMTGAVTLTIQAGKIIYSQ